MACTCGCVPEEHGHDFDYPSSTACSNCEECIAFEWDGEGEQPVELMSAATRAPKGKR